MNSREMKKEIYGYLAVYLEEFRLSDISTQMKDVVLHEATGKYLHSTEKPSEAAQLRYDRVLADVIHQFKLKALKEKTR
jgi:hypothetical protein